MLLSDKGEGGDLSLVRGSSGPAEAGRRLDLPAGPGQGFSGRAALERCYLWEGPAGEAGGREGLAHGMSHPRPRTVGAEG